MKKLFVIFAVIGLVGMFAATTMAADWGFYGSQRLATWYTIVDYADQVPDGFEDSDADLRWAQQGNSRIGANVKASDNLVGRFEYGNSGGNANIRILWAEYDFGGWKLGIGQHYTPVHAWVSSQTYADDAGLLDVGGIYGSRKDMLRLTAVGGALKVAFIEPSTAGVPSVMVDTTGDGEGDTEFVDTDVLLPKIEARFDMPLGDAGRMAVMGGVNMVSAEDIMGEVDETITSFVAGIMGAHNFGAFYFNWDAFYAQNADDYGLGGSWVVASDQAGSTVIVTTDAAGMPTDAKVEDATSIGALIAVGMSLSDTMSWEAGFGYRVDENDKIAKDPDDTAALYFQLPITLGAGFVVTPELGMYLGLDDGSGASDSDDVNVTYLGAKWQMNF